MFIVKRCLLDIDDRFPNEKNTEFKKRYYEYFVRMYVSSIASLKVIKTKEYLDQVKKAIKDNKVALKYAKKTGIKNLKILGSIKAIFGIGLATKLILKRY